MKIHVNADQWNALSAEEQKKIEASVCAACETADGIVADPAADHLDVQPFFFEGLLEKLVGCDGVAAAAYLLCQGTSAPPPICQLAAAAAREACEKGGEGGRGGGGSRGGGHQLQY